MEERQRNLVFDAEARVRRRAWRLEALSNEKMSHFDDEGKRERRNYVRLKVKFWNLFKYSIRTYS